MRMPLMAARNPLVISPGSLKTYVGPVGRRILPRYPLDTRRGAVSPKNDAHLFSIAAEFLHPIANSRHPLNQLTFRKIFVSLVTVQRDYSYGMARILCAVSTELVSLPQQSERCVQCDRTHSVIGCTCVDSRRP